MTPKLMRKWLELAKEFDVASIKADNIEIVFREPKVEPPMAKSVSDAVEPAVPYKPHTEQDDLLWSVEDNEPESFEDEE